MEFCFRVALWMLFVIGSLQAKPVKTEKGAPSGKPLRFSMNDLGFVYLKQDVSCGPNVTFISPTNVKIHCFPAALKLFKEGLADAKKNCTDEYYRIEQTLEFLDPENRVQTHGSPQKHSSACNWDEKESSKQFVEFVSDLERLVQHINLWGVLTDAN